jgi:hypothetical protein
MPRRNHTDIDFLRIKQEQARDEARQIREAANVLSSYSHALDFLAEALQNATDAIDERRRGDPEAPARILITFDVPRRQFSVSDTGVGMGDAEVEIVLTPNVTTKSGRYARSGSRSRGEKGVGLSFLALASNYLHIRTSDGTRRHDVTVSGGRDWVMGDGAGQKPMGKHESDDPDRHLGSSRYTVVTVGGIDKDAFDRDLFSYSLEELVWRLRTQTAIGNTRYLFEKPFSPRRYADAIIVDLRYIDASRIKNEQRVPYAYATPEELAPKRPVVEFDAVANVPTDELVRQLRGKAVRYVKRFRSPSNRLVSIYAFVTDGEEMAAILQRREQRRGWAPVAEWQGFMIATRDMPTGVPLGVSVVSTRGYERRMFVLIQEDELQLDLGRKTLHGQTRNMLSDVVRRAWTRDLNKIVPRVGAEKAVAPVDRAVLHAAIEQARKRRDLNAPIPYLKTPDSRAGVVAIFHELVARDDTDLPDMRTLRSGVFFSDDSLIYLGEPNGDSPLHVLFALRAIELVRQIEASGSAARTASLAVVWELGESALADRGVEVQAIEDAPDGATHILLLRGVANLDELRVIGLKSFLSTAR